MWAASRFRYVSAGIRRPWLKSLEFTTTTTTSSTDTSSSSPAIPVGGEKENVKPDEMLSLSEVEKVLSDVKAGDVTVIPVGDRCSWTDYMVIASGRSAWHVRNIAQALIYKVKQKQKGSSRMLLPSVEGSEGGNWVVVDSGNIMVHALDENARSYYNLESRWRKENLQKEIEEDLGKAFVKVRPIRNNKRKAGTKT